MASIDICYAVAAYKSVAEKQISLTRCKHAFVARANTEITDLDYAEPHHTRCPRPTSLNDIEAALVCVEHVRATFATRSWVGYEAFEEDHSPAEKSIRTHHNTHTTSRP